MDDDDGAAAAAVTGVDPPGRWRALALLSVALVLSLATWFSAAAVLPALRAELGLSTAQGGLLTIAVQVGFVLGALASALTNLADLVRPARLVLLGSLGAAVANLGLLVADELAGALLARLLVGAALALVYGPSLKAMSTWFRAQRGTALGVMVGALTLGSALPHLVNGLGGAAWRSVIVVTSVLSAAGGVVAALTHRDGPYPFPRTVFDPRAIVLVMRDQRVRLASIGYFGHMWELYAMWTWFAVYATDAFDGDATAASLMAFAVIGIGAAGCAVGGVLGDRLGRTRATTLAMAASGASALVAGALVDGPVAVVVVVGLFWGFWVPADSAQFSALVTEHADQRFVGTAVTTQLAVGFTLTVLTIFLVPVVRDATSWWLAFAMLAPGPAVGIVAMRRLAALPTRVAVGS